MDYTAPNYNAVDFELVATTYIVPAHNHVDFNFTDAAPLVGVTHHYNLAIWEGGG